MNDKELADKIAALGVITKDAFRQDMYSLQSTDGQFVGVRYEAEEIVRDWRVVGALMEKCKGLHLGIEMGALIYYGVDASAITEACVEALNVD